MRHRLTCHMFQQWKSQFINNRRMKSFLHRYKHTVVYKCWTKWLNVLFISKERKEKKSQRKKHLYRFTLNKMVSTTTSSLHVAWNSFKFHTMQSKHQEEMDDARLQRMRGVLFRLSTRSLHSSFNQWYSCVVVQKKVKRIMVRLSKNVVHRAWNSWSAFVALRMHNRTVVSRFLSKIMHHQLRKGKYFKAKESVHRVMEITVVDISIPPPSFKPVSLSLSRISFILKHPNKFFF